MLILQHFEQIVINSRISGTGQVHDLNLDICIFFSQKSYTLLNVHLICINCSLKIKNQNFRQQRISAKGKLKYFSSTE